MNRKIIREPKDVDLTIEGGDFSAADLKALRALLRKSKDELKSVQEKASNQPWIDVPIPTLQQLVALQRKQLEEEQRKRPEPPVRASGILDIDESGIGGCASPEESAYISAYIWSTRSPRKHTEASELASMFKEPAARYKAAARPKTKRTKK